MTEDEGCAARVKNKRLGEARAAEWKPQGDLEAELSAITEIHTRSIREAF